MYVRPGADTLWGTRKPFCLRVASAPALEALSQTTGAGTRRAIERMKQPAYPKRGMGHGTRKYGAS